MRIRLTWAAGTVEGELDDSTTAAKIAAALPHSASVNTWGQEIYFSVPVESTLDAAPQVVVDPGTICYWVQGSSIAIPFGPTPISEGGECRLVTAVNVIGKIQDDPQLLSSVKDGDSIAVERVS